MTQRGERQNARREVCNGTTYQASAANRTYAAAVCVIDKMGYMVMLSVLVLAAPGPVSSLLPNHPSKLPMYSSSTLCCSMKAGLLSAW